MASVARHPTLSRKKHPMTKPPRVKLLAITILGLVAGIIAYNALSAPDRRTGDQKFSDAVYDFSDGIDTGPGQFKNVTPDEKLKDVVIDTANDFKSLPTSHVDY